jgi:SAM-dependent methyltransferase
MNLERLQRVKLKYKGMDGPRGSVSYINGKTVKERDPEDSVAEHLLRCEIDRGSSALAKMKDESGKFLMEIVFDKYRSQQQIAVLDAGCGTGHTLYEIRDRLNHRVHVASASMTTVGVNDVDYSDESGSPETRAAIRNGEIQYIVDDLATIQLPSQAFDVIYSYETLIHNGIGKTAKIIDNLLPFLKQDGVLIFNITEDQWDNPRLRAFFDLQLGQYRLCSYKAHNNRFDDQRIFIAIQPR